LRTSTLLLTTICLLGAARAAEVSDAPAKKSGVRNVTATWSAADVSGCRRSKTVGPGAGGGLKLVERDLVQYEIGRTVHSRARVSAESVGGNVWARKDFVLESAKARSAELCVFTNGRLLVTLNGKALPSYERLHVRARPYSGVYPKDKFPEGHKMHRLNGKPYKEYWQGGWERIPIDVKLLRKGVNTVIMRSKPGETRRFLIEPSQYPNRSAVSRDGGATWDYDRLSRAKNINGEYIVRLLLERHPADGWIESEAVDLWPRDGDKAVAVPARLASVKLLPEVTSPLETRFKLQARLGSTPAYSPKTWTPWTDAAELAKGRVRGEALSDGGYRFLQWRAELTASGDRSEAPHLRGVSVLAEVTPTPAAGGAKPALKGCKLEQPRIVRSSHIFAHARNTERLKILKRDARLEEVVKGKARGLPQLLALAHFTKNTFGGNAGGRLKLLNSWDALTTWHNARGKDRLTGQMCTVRGAFFVQAATALGYPARPCIWSHAIAEAWVDELGKWVAFDPSGKFYLEVDNKPASMLEVSAAWDGETAGSPEKKVREVRGPKSRTGAGNNRKLAWFTRFWIPMRSNYLESPEPYETGQGTTGFKYDGYLRWLHPRKKPLPWFSLYTTRPGDIDFTCNTVRLHLARSAKTGALDVLVESDQPRPARLEARFGDGEWREVKPAFEWKLSEGKNALEVRGVNAFGFPGRSARAEVATAK
jgi:hypothetical protein